MKKIILNIVLALLLLSPVSVLAQPATTGTPNQGFTVSPSNNDVNAIEEDRNGFLEDSTKSVLQKFQEATGFRSFSGNSNADSIQKPGLDSLTGIIYTVVDLLKYVVGIIATLIIVISITRLIAANSDSSEEEFGKLKDNLLYAIIAVIGMISIDFFFKSVLVIGTDNFLSTAANAERFALAGAGELRGIYNFIQAIVGSVAVLIMTVAGFRLVANAGDEEAINKLKNQLIYGSAGLIIVAISEFVVKDIIFIDGGSSFSVQKGRELIVTFTNFISGFVTLAAFLGFIYAGYLYVTSGVGEDNAEKVKKIIIGGIIAILVSAGAFAIVNTVVRLDSSSSPAIIQNQLNNL